MNQLIREEMYPLEAGDGIPGINQEEKIPARAEGFVRQYTYDPRGNLIEEMSQEGRVLHGYAYDGMNRMERAWNDKGEEVAYLYNGMGQRVKKKSGSKLEEYILDFTKPYHNLLSIQREEETESFYWDYTTIATEKKGSSPRYYLQDELGSPLRVQYATGRGECYGYDEFGRDQAEEKRKISQEGFGNPYVKQGSTQPFGYTGYRYDGTSGSYFAQVREYQPHTGRFMAEDVIRGKLGVPKTLKRYGYCLSNPLMYVDLDGNSAIDILETGFAIGSGISLVDSPAPGPADVVGLVIIGVTVIVAGGVAIYEDIKQEEDVKEMAGAIAIEGVDDEDDIVIYRKGSSTMQNLTPREKDISGLSYVLVEPIGQSYTKTTIGQVNATGVLVAKIDGPNHVSVYPINPTELDIWIKTRPTANENPYYLTLLLRSISINHKGIPCDEN